MSSLGVLIYTEKMNIKTSPRLARVKKKSKPFSRARKTIGKTTAAEAELTKHMQK